MQLVQRLRVVEEVGDALLPPARVVALAFGHEGLRHVPVVLAQRLARPRERGSETVARRALKVDVVALRFGQQSLGRLHRFVGVAKPPEQPVRPRAVVGGGRRRIRMHRRADVHCEPALGEVRPGLAVLPRALKVAYVDGGGGQRTGLAGVAGVAAAPRTPDVSGLGAVVLGGGIAHLLEGVAAVAEVPDRQSLAKLAVVADDGG